MKQKYLNNSHGFASVFFILIAFLAFFAVAFFLASQKQKPVVTYGTNSQTPPPLPTPIATFEPISSQGQSYPLISKDFKSFHLSQLNDPSKGTKLIPISHSGSGSLGFGEDDPLASPDFGKVAYFGKEGLHIVTGDGKTDKLVSDQIKLGYFSGWSHDSNKLLVYGEPTPVTTENTTCEGCFYPDYESSPSAYLGYRPDFYLIDTQKGTITPEKKIKNYQKWIDNDQILVSNDTSKPLNLWVYSISGNKETTTIPDLNNIDNLQSSFSQDGKKWTMTQASISGGSRIILADFPKADGTLIDQGGWAYVQFPLISPDGTNIIYLRPAPDGTDGWVVLWENGMVHDLVNGRPPCLDRQ
jgi:hypothetical protein